MAKKKNKLDLKLLAKELGTKPHKTDSGLAEFIRFRGKQMKALINEDGSGGMSLKVPGIDDCFISGVSVEAQIEEIEEKIAAYIALKPDLKRLRNALKRAHTKVPEPPLKHGGKDAKRSSKAR